VPIKQFQNFRTTAVLVGAEGMLGSYFLKYKHLFEKLIVANIDITKPQEIDQLLKSLPKTYEKIFYVINCAAMTDVDKCEIEQDKAWEVNALGPKNLAISCKEYGCRLVHFSTDFVFDGTSRLGYDEYSKPNPINFYGKSKLEGEKLVLKYNGFVMRLSWLFGYKKSQGFPMRLIDQYNKGVREFKVAKDLYGSPTSCDSVVRLVVSLTPDMLIKYHLLHGANIGSVSKFNLAKQTFELAGIKDVNLIPALSEEFKTPAKRPKNTTLVDNVLLNVYRLSPVHYSEELKKCRW
jgi:dTDP-4-dehydrorhamnose reductase